MNIFDEIKEKINARCAEGEDFLLFDIVDMVEAELKKEIYKFKNMCYDQEHCLMNITLLNCCPKICPRYKEVKGIDS